jgi:uncharacterized Zn finger protein/DNA-binding transcriptional regulator YiaG
MGRSKRDSGYDGWAPYVPVAQRRAQALKKMDKLRKKGEAIQPIEIEGRTIARSFWGKGWCSHLESFGDYSNRLPRGRSYVRNGSVCHLGINKGEVEAIVSGSSLYRVKVTIAPLKKTKWHALKKRCTGKIGSLIELLQGSLSDEIMGTVTDPAHGLFPLSGEIKYRCNCPDGARMCKHIAAIMYGIGARLDTQPDLLFLLRGVDHEELITAGAAADAITGTGSRRSGRRALAGQDLESVFGVELDDAAVELPATPRRRRPTTRKKAPAKVRTKPPAPRPRKPAPFKPTARSIAKLRSHLGMNRADFARAVGVSAATITKWEKARGAIKPQAKGLAGLIRLHALG